MDYRFDPDLLVSAVTRGRTPVEHPARQVIFAQGAAADSVFFIVSGGVKLVVTSEEGKEAVVALLEAGDAFGEGCLAGQPLRLATAIAMAPTAAVRIDKAEMIRALHADAGFAEAFTAYLLARNSRVEADLLDHLFNSSERRLARLLLLLAHFGKDEAPQPIGPRLSQETLAEMIGTTRPRVSHFMNKFRKLGYIEYNGKLKVHPSLLNVVLHHTTS